MEKMCENEYFKKLKSWYLNSRKFIKNTVFTDNYYENPKSSLFKPVFTSEKNVLIALRMYSKNKKDTKLREMIFNHYIILIVYVSSYQMKKYYGICNDIQNYISINSETFIKCLNRYNPNTLTNFTTYYINSANNNIRHTLMDMCDYDIPFGRNLRSRFEHAKMMIDECYNGDYNKIWNDFDKKEFKKTFNFHKIYFFELLNRHYISLQDLLTNDVKSTSNDTFETFLVDKTTNCESTCVDKCVLDSLYEYLRERTGCRNYRIWKEFNIDNRGITYEFLAYKYNLTRERIRQILNMCNDIIKRSKIYRDIA